MDDKKSEHGSHALSPSALAGPAGIVQLRQLSIPLSARIAAVILAVAVLAVGAWMVFDGWRNCVEHCHEKALENGTNLLVAAVLPAVAVIYLAFAETGVKALKRKIGELLKQMIPEALQQEWQEEFVIAGEITECEVVPSYADGSPRARYSVTAKRNGEAVVMYMLVELNVAKVNVVFFIPASAGIDAGKVRADFKETIRGAVHEGYTFDEDLPETAIDGRNYLRLVARKRLPDNFLWDPGLKLHFAQDLRMFVHSAISEGWKLLEKH